MAMAGNTIPSGSAPVTRLWQGGDLKSQPENQVPGRDHDGVGRDEPAPARQRQDGAGNQQRRGVGIGERPVDRVLLTHVAAEVEGCERLARLPRDDHGRDAVW
jgi:hypothetical protein